MPWNDHGHGPWGAPPSGGDSDTAPRPRDPEADRGSVDRGSADRGGFGAPNPPPNTPWGTRPGSPPPRPREEQKRRGDDGGGGDYRPSRSSGRPTGRNDADLGRMLSKGGQHVRNAFPGGLGGGRSIALILAAGVAAWLASGVYTVEDGHRGIVTVFGRYTGTPTEPGVHYALPTPIGAVSAVDVQRVQTIAFGIAGTGNASRDRFTASDRSETASQMLTQEGNIVDVGFTVGWQVKDAAAFSFAVDNPQQAVEALADSLMRERIGRTAMAELISGSARDAIQADVQQRLQKGLDGYGAGIAIAAVTLQAVKPPSAVGSAVQDVANAGQDRDRRIAEARAYAAKAVPDAKAEAARQLADAEGYKAQALARAEGEAGAFDAIYRAYSAAPDVTVQRLYLETMEAVLQKSHKVVLPTGIAPATVAPYLPQPVSPIPTSPAAAAPEPARP